jgi:hypothetical protein
MKLSVAQESAGKQQDKRTLIAEGKEEVTNHEEISEARRQAAEA